MQPIGISRRGTAQGGEEVQSSPQKVAGSLPDSAQLAPGIQGWLDVRPSVDPRHLFNRSSLHTHREQGRGELTPGKGLGALNPQCSWRLRAGGQRARVHQWELLCLPGAGGPAPASASPAVAH